MALIELVFSANARFKRQHIQLDRPVVPDLLALAAFQLLQADGQWQQQVTEVLTGKGEGVMGRGFCRWCGERRGCWRRRGGGRDWRGGGKEGGGGR